MREKRDDSGSFLLRRVEIMREPGLSLGFFIRQGDGWLRKNGVFVSRVNLGSSIDTNGLLNIGDEIICVNNVDVTQMLLNDVVLVMKFVKRMILTVKVLTAFGFSSDLSLHKSLLSRELPKLPQPHSGTPGDQGQSSEREIPKVKRKRHIEERRLHFQSTRVDSAAKSTNFGESFMKNLGGTMEEVGDANVGSRDAIVINPYEEVSYDVKRHQEPAKPVMGDDSTEISPYARVSLRTEGVSEGGRMVVEIHPQKDISGGSPKAVGISNDESAEISPYSSRTDGTGQGVVVPQRKIDDGGNQKASGIPDDEYAEISPYARISLRMEGTGMRMEAHPEKELGNGEDRRAISDEEYEEISPYARVSLWTESAGRGERSRIMAQSDRGRWRPYEEIELGPDKTRLGGGNVSNSSKQNSNSLSASIDPYEEVTFAELQPNSSETQNNPYEAIEKGSHMNMDSLLSLLHAKNISHSPAVKQRSNIMDDVVVSPDHVYAQIDRTRKYSSSEEEEVEGEAKRKKKRNLSNTTPPPAPTSPLPRDDSMSVLADIFSKPLLSDESQESGDVEVKFSPALSSHHHVASCDPEILEPSDINSEFEGEENISTDEVLDLLGEEDPVPPLPPPYVPDEGPPDTSDEEDDSELENEASTVDGSLGANPLVETALPVIRAEVGTTLRFESSEEHVTVPQEVGGADSTHVVLENFDKEHSPTCIEVSMPIQQSRKLVSSSAPDLEEGKDSDRGSLPDTYSADESGSLEEVAEEKTSSDSRTHRNMSQDSFSDLPPPPLPPTDPPEDEISDVSTSSDQEDVTAFTLLVTSSGDKIEGGELSTDQNLLSGMIILRLHGLDITSVKSKTFWSSYDVQKVTFVTAVDGKVKITANVPFGKKSRVTSDESSESDDYQFLLFNNSKITFSINPVCLPTISKQANLCEVFPTGAERLRRVYIDFEAYGRLKLSLEHRPMRAVVRRIDGDGYSNPTFSDLVGLNPSNSGCPLVLEQCMEVIERYGLKTPHLYERCTLTQHKHRALAACVKNLNSPSIKSVLVRCSVHAYTGLIMDFFRDLPEPFFTDISSTLTQSSSVDGTTVGMLESFMLCLPDEVCVTLNILLRHLHRVIEHGDRNGVTVKSIARLFGPLMLIPSLMPHLSVSTTTLDYAEDYKSQAKVMELLLSRNDTL